MWLLILLLIPTLSWGQVLSNSADQPITQKPVPSKVAVTKIDDHTISVEKTFPEKKETVHYDYEFLLSQRNSIQEDLDNYTAKRQAELNEVNDLIQKSTDAGIVPNDQLQ